MKRPKRRMVPFLGCVIGLLLLTALPVYASSYQVIFLTNLFMYVIITLSWVIFSGPTGYISLATAAFFGTGVYAAAVLSDLFPPAVIVLIGGLVSFGLAFLVGALTLRLRGMYFTMFTFALVQLIWNFANWYEVNITGTVGRLVIAQEPVLIYYYILALVVLVLVTSALIRRSRFGLALQCIGESEEAAAHSGIDVTRIKVITFGISAFFMGAVGAVMTMRWTYVDPQTAFDIRLSFMPLLMAIFGGMGNLFSPIVGSSVFAVLEEVLTTKFPYYYMLLFGTAMLAVIVFMPHGLEEIIQKLRRSNGKDSMEN